MCRVKKLVKYCCLKPDCNKQHKEDFAEVGIDKEQSRDYLKKMGTEANQSFKTVS